MSDNENVVSDEETSTKETWIIKEDLPSVTTPINGVLIDGTINSLTGNNTYGEPIKAGILSISNIIPFNYGPHIPGSMIYGVYYGPIPGGDVSEKIWYYMTSDGTRYFASDTTKLRTITFDTAPTGDLLTWLKENAVKRIEGDLPIGDKKKAVNLQDLVYIRQYIDKKMKSETDGIADDYYNKSEIDEMKNDYYDKTSSEEIFYKKTDTVANAENAENASNDEEGNSIVETYQKKNETVNKASMLDVNLSGDNNAYNVIDISETGSKDNLNLASGLYHLMIISGEQTWKFNDVINTDVTDGIYFNNIFKSNNETFAKMTVTTDGRLIYIHADGSYGTVYDKDESPDHWKDTHGTDNTKYKVVTFTVPPTGDLLDYLEENATLYFEDGNTGDSNTVVNFSGLITIPKYGNIEIPFNELYLKTVQTDDSNTITKLYLRDTYILRYLKNNNNGTFDLLRNSSDSGQVLPFLVTNHKILYRKISD